MAIRLLAVNDPFLASDENDIAAQINQMHAYITYAGANETTPAAGTATWVTMGNVTVPAWATRARVSLAICGITSSAADTRADLAVKIGTAAGAARRLTGVSATVRAQDTYNMLLTSVPTGSQSVIVQATFSAGQFTATSGVCSFDLNIDWMQ